MRNHLLILLVVLSTTTLWAQINNEWRRAGSNKIERLPVTKISESNQTAISLSAGNYVLQLLQTDSNQVEGHLILYTSTYTEGDYKSLYSQRYFDKRLISPDTARLILKLYNDLKISAIPGYEKINGWRLGNDGITYTIESMSNGVYSSKSYWSPWAFKSLPEAVAIDKFISQLEDLVQYGQRRKLFLASLPKGQSYRFGSLSIVTVAEQPKDASWINNITIKYQSANEPPVTGGRSVYELKFDHYKSDLAAANYSIGKDRVVLEDTVLLRSSLVKTIVEWAKDKKEFSLNEIDLRSKDLRAESDSTKYELKLPMPDDLSINLDSLTFCKKYLMKKIVSTGGNHISVIITYNNHEVRFQFDNSNLLQEFDLKAYLTCYAILKDAIPEEFPAYQFFSEDILVRLLYEYQKIVECEGFYYKEYVSKHPELTAQERRTMKGWDFARYLNETRGIR